LSLTQRLGKMGRFAKVSTHTMRKASVYRLTKAVSRLLLSPFFDIKTSGREHLPAEGGFVLFPKHQRWEDIPLLGLASPRPVYYVAKFELFQNPISGWFISALGGIPLNRGRPMESRTSLKGMLGYMGKGEGIVVFPEGTYYRNEMGPGRSGLIRMILSRSKVPLIPVGISYVEGVGRTTVLINFGKPLQEEVPGIGADELLDRVMGAIEELSGLS
jgi:1-acyl-sn-glycerol-3-phosphate acyltransferase